VECAGGCGPWHLRCCTAPSLSLSGPRDPSTGSLPLSGASEASSRQGWKCKRCSKRDEHSGSAGGVIHHPLALCRSDTLSLFHSLTLSRWHSLILTLSHSLTLTRGLAGARARGAGAGRRLGGPAARGRVRSPPLAPLVWLYRETRWSPMLGNMKT